MLRSVRVTLNVESTRCYYVKSLESVDSAALSTLELNWLPVYQLNFNFPHLQVLEKAINYHFYACAFLVQSFSRLLILQHKGLRRLSCTRLKR